MADMQESWKEVAGKAEALGLKLKMHLAQERDETEDGGEKAEADAKAIIDDLGKRVQEAFDSAGNAAKDPAVHEDVKEIGRLLKDALLSTVHEVQHRVEEATHKNDAGDTVDEEE